MTSSNRQREEAFRDREAALEEKKEALLASLREMKSAVVALSGGVDSALLAAAAHRALGDRAVALTVQSALTAQPDREDAARVAEGIGIGHFHLVADELANEDLVSNDPRKCYHCKKLRLAAMTRWAAENGYDVVLDGSNADDEQDYRPGMEAVREFEAVKSPLQEQGFTKDEVRALARAWGIEVWNKPAGACLATRVAPPQRIERDILQRIDEAETYLRGILPPYSQVRVRHHGELARIETDEICTSIIAARAREVRDVLREIGYRYITLDLGGYTVGSLNPESCESGAGLGESPAA